MKKINTIALVAAMNIPPKKASGIRVMNELEWIIKKYKVNLYCVKSSKKIVKNSNLKVFYSRHALNSNDYYQYYSKIQKFKIILDLSLRLAKDLRFRNISMIHAHTIEGILIAIFSMILSLKKIPLIADMHGPFVNEVFHYKIVSKNKFNEFLLQKFESFLYFFCDKIFVTSTGLKRYIQKSNSARNKIYLMSDYVNLSLFRSNNANNINFLRSKKKSMLMYVGTLKDYQGLDDFFYAIQMLVNEQIDINVVIVGDGGLGIEYYKKLAEKLSISSYINFIGQVPHKEVPHYISLADIMVSPRKKTPVTHYGFVSQMPEYLAMMKVVVATDISDCNLMLSGGAGFLCKPNNPKSLAEAIKLAIRSKSQWPKLKKLSIQRAYDYSWEKNSKRLYQLYESLL